MKFDHLLRYLTLTSTDSVFIAVCVCGHEETADTMPGAVEQYGAHCYETGYEAGVKIERTITELRPPSRPGGRPN